MIGYHLLSCMYTISRVDCLKLIAVSPLLLCFLLIEAPPRSPYPSIEQCLQNTTGNEQDCSLHIALPINITCTIFGYFPDISLYFRLNSTSLQSSVQSREWENTDGTINKEITVTAETSDVPYTCVAADIPWIDQEQVANIYLYALLEESTTVSEEHTTILSTEGSSNRNDRLISTYMLTSSV